MAKKVQSKTLDSIDLVIQHVRKKYGNDSAIFRLGEKVIPSVEVIPTGMATLDLALGTGGFPRGRIIEIFGKEASGKTTLALQFLAQAQRRFPDKQAAFIDVENAFDRDWAALNGIDVDNLIISQPDTAEEALDLTVLLTQTGSISGLVLDSVAALCSRKELEGEMSDNTIGLVARLMGQALRKIKHAALANLTCVAFLNQVRQNISAYGGEVTPGGNALKHFASHRIRVRESGKLAEGTEIIGIDIEATVKKNKLAPPFRTAIMPLLFSKGFYPQLALVDAAIEADIIHRSGSWMSYNGTNFAQGRMNAAKILEENPEMMEEIYQKLDGQLARKIVVQRTQSTSPGE